MKTLLALLIVLLPCTLGVDCHPVYNSFEQQLEVSRIRTFHGECAIATDLTHGYRANNGELIKF